MYILHPTQNAVVNISPLTSHHQSWLLCSTPAEHHSGGPLVPRMWCSRSQCRWKKKNRLATSPRTPGRIRWYYRYTKGHREHTTPGRDYSPTETEKESHESTGESRACCTYYYRKVLSAYLYYIIHHFFVVLCVRRIL